MRVTQLGIKNYRSFDKEGQIIKLNKPCMILVGKNNAGKSNLLNAIDILLGSRNTSFIKFEKDDFHDTNHPIEISATISEISENDRILLCSLPSLTKQQMAALSGAIKKNNAKITINYIRYYKPNDLEDVYDDEISKNLKDKKDSLNINLWGFEVHKKHNDVRKALIEIILVPSNRNYANDLNANKWSIYGNLMKNILSESSHFPNIRNSLKNLNSQIQSAFIDDKDKILEDVRTVGYIEDINFQLTRNLDPSELLRNLEIIIKEIGQ